MHATEIVVKEIQGNLMGMILKFLTESVGEASVAAHPHPHREVAAFHETCADVLGIGLATENASATANAGCRTVTRFGTVVRRAVDLNQHRVINLGAERIFDSIGVHTMAISCKLDSIADSRSNVLHESFGGRSTTIPQRVRNDQLGISVDCRPRPNVASTLLHLFQCDVLLLRVDERPYFVTLDSPHAQIANVRMVVGSTGATQVLQQSQYCVLSDSQHPTRRIDGVAFHQCAYDLALFIGRQAIHDAPILRNRSRISQEENALDFRERSRIINPDGKKAEKPVCCSAGAQGRQEGWPRSRSQYDRRGTQRQCAKRCAGAMGETEGIERRDRCLRRKGRLTHWARR